LSAFLCKAFSGSAVQVRERVFHDSAV